MLSYKTKMTYNGDECEDYRMNIKSGDLWIYKDGKRKRIIKKGKPVIVPSNFEIKIVTSNTY